MDASQLFDALSMSLGGWNDGANIMIGGFLLALIVASILRC